MEEEELLPDMSDTSSDEEYDYEETVVGAKPSPLQRPQTPSTLHPQTPSTLHLVLQTDEENTTMDGETHDDSHVMDIDDLHAMDIVDPNEELSMRQKKERQKSRFAALIANEKQKLKDKPVAPSRDDVDEDQMSAKLMISSTNVIINDPREYQMELFEIAKTRNTIAVLDTGSGKTLIACLLLRHTVDHELQARLAGLPRRVSFFLVDSVTLVFQQAAVLECNLDAPIGKYCGAMGVDIWTKEHWDDILSRQQVIVLTADVLHNCLTHGLVKMTDINLICFDEAHHAKKNHVYARIIRDFYANEPEDARPRIFGMTASPVDSRDDPTEAALELERLLHSRISTASDLKLLQNSVSRPDEMILAYPRLGAHFRTPLYNKLYDKFNKVKCINRIFKFCLDSSSQLGGWCADEVWKVALSEQEAIKLENRKERMNRTNDIAGIEKVDMEIKMIREARQIVAEHEFTEPELIYPLVSSKVLKLLQFLDHVYSEATDDKCIIFVTQRYTAYVLAALLNQTGPAFMKLGVLIGTRSGSPGEENVTFRQQMVTVSRFRKGRLNCLIATSVAEEGLDIPDCSKIVRFDLYTTMIQYIQSRGRARHSTSKYVQMVETNNTEHATRIIEVRMSEDIMRKFCQKLPEDRVLRPTDNYTENQSNIFYIEPSTGAKLTPYAALQLLWRFTNSLPQDSEYTNPPAYYIRSTGDKEFICEIVLPPNSPILSVEGKPSKTKAEAKQSAAYEACLQLRAKDYLNEYLLPLGKAKSIPSGANSHLSLDNAKANSYPIRLKPSIWEVAGQPLPDQLYVTVLGLVSPEAMGRPYQPLCVVTRKIIPEIPNFTVYADRGGKSEVFIVTLNSTIPLTPELLERLNSFTHRFFYDVFAKTFEINNDIPYWIHPIKNVCYNKDSKPEDLFDQELVDLIMENTELKWDENTPLEFFNDRLFLHRSSRSRRFFTLHAIPELTPHSEIPIGACTAPKSATIYDYSYFERAKGADFVRENFDRPQPVLKATRVLHRINYLDAPPEREKMTPLDAYIIPSAFEISCLPPAFAAFSIVFPAISTRMDAYLHAQDVCELMGINISLDVALEAITKDSENTHDDTAAKIGQKKGMSANYERLEFLGDTFLKLTTTLSLFVDYGDDDEYQMHVKRMWMVCNQNLFDNAKVLKLPEYIQTQGFSRREWYPRIKLLMGRRKKPKKTATSTAAPTTNDTAKADESTLSTYSHRLAPKTIADVCEALIGAAVQNKGFDEGVKVINSVVNHSDHDKTRFTCWQSYFNNYRLPSYQTAEPLARHLELAKQIEEKIGYKFNYPRLLASAFIHPSIPYSWEGIPCYQRLEFLGDALHDQACIKYIFDKYPDKNPQWLTEHKMAMVSNKFLAALAVNLGFHRHLRKTGAGMQHNIQEFVEDVENAEKSAEGATDYWVHISGAIPKALGDCLEAFIGAMFVDSNFDFSVVNTFFDKFIKPSFIDMTIYDTYAGNHPTTLLTTKLNKEVGCEDWRILSEETSEGDSTLILSAVMVHNNVFAHATAANVKQARVKASQKALERLGDMGLQKFSRVCDCATVREHLRTLKQQHREAEKAERMERAKGGEGLSGLRGESLRLREEVEGKLAVGIHEVMA